MPPLRIGQLAFDADLVAFDKDGTLIDFEFMWGRIARAWVDHLASGPHGESLRRELYHALGYDADRQRTKPQSPLAVASTGQLQTIAAATLYRCGIPWPEAEDRAQAAIRSARARQDLSPASLVRPAGDVAGLFRRLQDAGVRVGVVTTDERAETEETLRVLHVADLVDSMVCGDDGWAIKPAPDMLLALCERLGVEPSRTIVVGDTEGDMLMAQRSGAGLRVAVLTGAGDSTFLTRLADAVIPSIDDISVLDDNGPCPVPGL